MNRIKEWLNDNVTLFDVTMSLIIFAAAIIGIIAIAWIISLPTKPNTVICITPTPIVRQQ